MRCITKILCLLLSLFASIKMIVAQNTIKPLLEWDVTAFCSYNSYHPYNYLNADNNWEILCALRTEHLLSELQSMGVNYSQSQIMLLHVGGFLKYKEKRWVTTMPIFDKKETDSIRNFSKQIAEILYSKMENDYRSFLKELSQNGYEDNSFSLTFSYLLDGKAWNKISPKKQELGNYATWTGVIWAMYAPRQQQKIGTNGFGALRLNWTDSLAYYPNNQIMFDFQNEFIKNRKVTDAKLIEQLYRFGVVDQSGKITIPIINETETNEFNTICDVIIEKLASVVEGNLEQFMKIADMQNKELSTVIFYHELIWDLMELLQKNRLIRMPRILLSSQAPQKEIGNLMFFTVKQD